MMKREGTSATLSEGHSFELNSTFELSISSFKIFGRFGLATGFSLSFGAEI